MKDEKRVRERASKVEEMYVSKITLKSFVSYGSVTDTAGHINQTLLVPFYFL